MKAQINKSRQILWLVLTIIILSLWIVHPFLAGKYDRNALPISTIIQAAGILGTLLSFVGAYWIFFPSRKVFISRLFILLLAIVGTLLVLFTYFILGLSGCVLVILLAGILVVKIKGAMSSWLKDDSTSVVPVYLIVLPIYVVFFQLIASDLLTSKSRSLAIGNASVLVTDLNRYYENYGFYPNSLQAMYPDYSPGLVGIEKYYYMRHDGAYSLSFEQPRLLLDVIGTREWVVFNPLDEHKVYSHASWLLLLSPSESGNSQGWYGSKETEVTHWKRFFFD